MKHVVEYCAQCARRVESGNLCERCSSRDSRSSWIILGVMIFSVLLAIILTSCTKRDYKTPLVNTVKFCSLQHEEMKMLVSIVCAGGDSVSKESCEQMDELIRERGKTIEIMKGKLGIE